MNTAADWIKHHQVAAFFIITFAITWGLGFSYDAVINRGQFWLAPLVMIATCGPALAGILVTSISNPSPKRRAGRTYWIAFFAALVVSTFVMLAHNTLINHAPINIFIVVFSFVSALPVAYVISMAFSGNPAVKRYMASLIRVRGSWRWQILALVLIPSWVLLSIFISSLFGRTDWDLFYFPAAGFRLALLIAVTFFYQIFFFNATGEEVGWRGFALPRLQAAISPLAASLVLNLVWPLWHLFLWEAEGVPVQSLAYWGQRYLELVPASVALGWIYNRSKGSIMAAGIGHAAANTVFAFFPRLDWLTFVWTATAVALVLVVLDRMWKKLPSDHPAVYHNPETGDQGNTMPAPIPTHP